ncbi:MAG: hypothetical protein CM15mP120_20920 [Pseudomonadota bacterium]|nr:MAG: hypothetical protein CM15mP120_20920 [Pseudomonadota bacterium]
MAKALFYQPHCGIAGDMHLAALIDLGVPVDHLQTQLARLNLADKFSSNSSQQRKWALMA